MKRIFHAGGSVVTGSDLADAVLHYARALGNRGEVGLATSRSSMRVQRPGVHGSSSTDSVELLDSEIVEFLHRSALGEPTVLEEFGW